MNHYIKQRPGSEFTPSTAREYNHDYFARATQRDEEERAARQRRLHGDNGAENARLRQENEELKEKLARYEGR